MIEVMIAYLLSLSGTPYIWGGSTPMQGFDCSGLVQEGLMSIGIDPPGDQTAQALYDHLSQKGWRSGLKRGSVLFFGRTRKRISHTSIALDNKIMIEAGGGGSKTKTIEDAIKHQAFVRVRPINNRRDLIAAIMPPV